MLAYFYNYLFFSIVKIYTDMILEKIYVYIHIHSKKATEVQNYKRYITIKNKNETLESFCFQV